MNLGILGEHSCTELQFVFLSETEFTYQKIHDFQMRTVQWCFSIFSPELAAITTTFSLLRKETPYL